MKCVSGIEVMPLLVVVHRMWRWWMLEKPAARGRTR